MKAALKKVLISVVALLSSYTSQECADYPYFEFFRISSFDPNFLNFDELNAFTYNSDYYNGSVESEKYDWAQNIEQWYEYCSDESINHEDIRVALYSSERIGVLTNPFLIFLRDNKPEAYSYISELLLLGLPASDATSLQRFQDNWDSFATPDSYYNVYQSGNPRSHEFLWPQVEAHLNSCADPFVKKRWAYQALVSAFYQNENEKVKFLFNEYFTRENRTWIDNSAQHYYAQVSENCKELLLECVIHGYDKQFRNIQLINAMSKDNETWINDLSDTTRSYYYFVKGLREYGRGLANMKEVYELNPKNRYLDFLINREVNKIEDWLLDSEIMSNKEYFESYYWDDGEEDNLSADKRYTREVLSFVRSIKSKSLFREMVVVYLESLLGEKTHSFNPENYRSLENQYVQARILDFLVNFKEKTATGEYRKDLLYIFENVHKIEREETYYSYDDEDEEPDFMRQQLARRLGNFMTKFKGYRLEGFLLSGKSSYPQNESRPFWGITPYINLFERAEPEECIAIVEILMRSDDDPYLKFLKVDEIGHEKVHYCTSFEGSKEGEYDPYKILDIAAQKYVGLQKFEEALKIYERFPEEYWESACEEMPFVVNIYRSRDAVLSSDGGYFNKLTFLKQFIEYQKQLKNNPKNGLLNYYVGNAYYSMSKLGGMWYIASPYNSMDSYSEARKSFFIKKSAEHFERVVKYSDKYDLKSMSLLSLHWIGMLNQRALNEGDHGLYTQILWNCDRYQEYLDATINEYTSVYAGEQGRKRLLKFRGFERYNGN